MVASSVSSTSSKRATFSGVRRWTMSRSVVVIGTPWSTAATPPTMMNSTPASQSVASNAGRSAALGCNGITNPDEHLCCPGRGPQPIPGRLLQCERDQRTVHVIDRRADLRVEGLDEGLDRRRLGGRRPGGSCNHAASYHP